MQEEKLGSDYSSKKILISQIGYVYRCKLRKKNLRQ